MDDRQSPPWARTVHAALDASLTPPPEGHRLRRALYGALLPFAVLRSVLRDPAARARYWRFSLWQLGAMVGTTLAIFFVTPFPKLGWTAKAILQAASAVYGTLCVAEMIVLALAREYQDAVTGDAAALTGAPLAPADRPPRVGVDLEWIWLKVRRRMRAALILASGAPIFAVAYLSPIFGENLYQALGAVWALHWLAIFCIGGAPRAWDLRPARDPWFLRLSDTLGKVPIIGGFFRLYAKLWRRWFLAVVPVCVASEAAPYEAAGLALARGVAGFPGLYIFLRPVFPVAATHVLLARVPEAREEAAALPADPSAAPIAATLPADESPKPQRRASGS